MFETLILAAGIPSAAIGFCFWFLEKKLEARAAAEKEERQRRQKEFDEREKKQEQLQIVVINSVNACMSLSKQRPEPYKEFQMLIAMEICTQRWNMQRK
ncbi:MAG: hypothetical protein ACLS3U_05070 [Lachnospiraceae bacterium]